jgi:hypothetical protein
MSMPANGSPQQDLHSSKAGIVPGSEQTGQDEAFGTCNRTIWFRQHAAGPTHSGLLLRGVSVG